MTGFGKAVGEFQHKKINVEIKSLNSKQLDLNAKITGLYREKELEYRNIAGNSIIRGKSEIAIYVENLGEEPKAAINQDLAVNYWNDIKSLAQRIGEDNVSLLTHVLRMPDVLKTDRPEIPDEEWKVVTKTIDEALKTFNQFRIDEGSKLEEDFKLRLANILSFLSEIEKLEEERINNVKEKLSSSLNILADKIDVDQNRFEQELIYYLEKLDITEEKVRLRSHCDYFMTNLSEGDAQGKKLGFIAQEMGREINTIGSKANHSEIQKLVVQMKDDLEKIKEQVLNVL